MTVTAVNLTPCIFHKRLLRRTTLVGEEALA
jgi:hypothetical protein